MFLQDSEISEENIEDILNDFSHLFHIEKTGVPASENQQIWKEKRKILNLEEIKATSNLTPSMIDFDSLIKFEKPLYGYDDKVIFFFQGFFPRKSFELTAISIDLQRPR